MCRIGSGLAVYENMRGFTLVELLVAMLVSMIATGALLRILDASQEVVGPQLETADVQQRGRVGIDVMLHDLAMAGADRTDGVSPPFAQVTPGIVPYRRGTVADDPSQNVFYRPDTLTIFYIAASAAPATLTSHTYYAKADVTSGALQLMHYNGASGDFPLLDNVVHLSFEYFGDPQPPVNLPPPDVLVDPDPSDEYRAGENCLFTRADGDSVPRLSLLNKGTALVSMPASTMTDGPWCPSGASPTRFDADLLRLRRVRVRLRVQASADIFRGPAGALFSRGGINRKALRMVPDLELRVDVTPRNLSRDR